MRIFGAKVFARPLVLIFVAFASHRSPAFASCEFKYLPIAPVLKGYLVNNIRYPQIDDGLRLGALAAFLENPISGTDLLSEVSTEQWTLIIRAMNSVHQHFKVPIQTASNDPEVTLIAPEQVKDVFNLARQSVAVSSISLIELILANPTMGPHHEAWIRVSGAMNLTMRDHPETWNVATSVLDNFFSGSAYFSHPDFIPYRLALRSLGQKINLVLDEPTLVQIGIQIKSEIKGIYETTDKILKNNPIIRARLQTAIARNKLRKRRYELVFEIIDSLPPNPAYGRDELYDAVIVASQTYQQFGAVLEAGILHAIADIPELKDLGPAQVLNALFPHRNPYLPED